MNIFEIDLKDSCSSLEIDFAFVKTHIQKDSCSSED